jgi:hypothetical protein
MNMIDEKLAGLAVQIPEVVLPAAELDLKKWASIACDQFTQDAGYWTDFAAFVGEEPSALKLVLPEVFLSQSDPERTAYVKKIHSRMGAYLRDKTILQKPQKGAVFVERQYKNRTRRGLLIAVDMEQFDWRDAEHKPIRATEGTIEERLPVRMEIRRGAALEVPHVILLYDDPENILMGLVGNLLKDAPVAYAAPLYGAGGKVLGKLMRRENDWSFIANCFEFLSRNARTAYGESKSDFLFAVGDGNHSLCAAKAVWDEYKKEHSKEKNLMSNPLRWAMVEIENIHDAGLVFEPIHQILFGTGIEAVKSALEGMRGYSERKVESAAELQKLVSGETAGTRPGANRYGLIQNGRYIYIEAEGGKTATVDLEVQVKNYLMSNPDIKIDYIHGENELFALADGGKDDKSGNGEKSAVGILLPPFDKKLLFPTVAKNGPLPRKSFSMGDAAEKRYYIECRKIAL